ncbi:hypothetical protein, partial [Streptomyces clavuligerus]|uniref:hypothetical protein n=1 Tax=Streptomyces clavuligerus TaxID=1901 RepID=UPI0027DD1744
MSGPYGHLLPVDRFTLTLTRRRGPVLRLDFERAPNPSVEAFVSPRGTARSAGQEEYPRMITRTTLGSPGLTVSAMGLGCMG